MSLAPIRMVAICALEACSDIFSKRPSEITYRARAFCTRRCFVLSRRTGRTKAEAICSGCGIPFMRVKAEVTRKDRRQHFYCGQPCYLAHVDRAALGRIGGAAPKYISPEKKRERSRKGGLARGRNLSKARLKEISQLGVEARRKMTLEEWRAARRRGAATHRFGTDSILGVRLGKRPC